MEDDIAKILGGLVANQHGPSPSGARVGNSPLAGAMRRRGHGRNVSLSSPVVKASRPLVESQFGRDMRVVRPSRRARWALLRMR